eukprot:m.220193 g.220193  ORF g.220193 m.220193 type:complete len:83 (+) comp26300_c0_seq18:171-419(+)
MVITIFTFGIKVPAGLFIPTMAVGATMGRILGELMREFAEAHQDTDFIRSSCPEQQTCITPGISFHSDSHLCHTNPHAHIHR